MRVLELFSGIGGFSLGLERAGMETVAFCEIEDYPRRVLAKHWPEVPCYEDIRELSGERLADDGIAVDLICGGYPCQPFSTAGKRQGAGDDRHLWPEYLRLIQELRPSWVIGENVAGHISMGLDNVLSDLENEGYTWEAFVIPACAVDAPHRRDRVWIVANAISQRGHGSATKHGAHGREVIAGGSDLSNSNRVGLEGRHSNAPKGHGQAKERPSGSLAGTWCQWAAEPAVGRVAHGIPRRVDRLRALGNAVVPQIPEIIGRAIMEIEGK